MLLHLKVTGGLQKIKERPSSGAEKNLSESFSYLFSSQGEKMKEKLTPILNLLTESCRAHRETRHYIRKHVMPQRKHDAAKEALFRSHSLDIHFFKLHFSLSIPSRQLNWLLIPAVRSCLL